MKGTDITNLAYYANSACTKCHGRGIICAAWQEYHGDHFYEPMYEENLCKCIPEPVSEMLFEMVEELWDEIDKLPFISYKRYCLYEMAHWGCKECKLELLVGMREDDGHYINILETEKLQLERELSALKG